MVISNGGDPGSLTISSVKRKFDELISVNSDLAPTLRKFKGKSDPITFYLEELPDGAPNATIPLLVRARMTNFDVRRVLVDEGSSVDIMYSHLFRTLQLDDSHLTPYVGSDLQGFNGATTKPWGYVELIVTFGEEEASRQVKTRFLVIDCKTLYNCIFGRPTLAELTAVPSTVHLKMKFYTKRGGVATINADIRAARRIFDASVKGLQLIAPPSDPNKKLRAEDNHPREDQHPPNVSSIDLDARFTDEELKNAKERRPKYEGRKALKAQALAVFVAEMTSISNCPTPTENKWTIYVDGASSNSGSGAGIILENDEGLIIEVSLVLSFTTSNNQAEYEALLAGLRLAEDVGAREVMIYTDSQLVASQVSDDYQSKNDTLAEYLTLVKEKMKRFSKADVAHIPREHNSRADILSKLASTRKKGGNKSVIQEILPRPSISKNAQALQVFAIGDDHCWMTPVYNFLTKEELPADAKEASAIKRRARSYTIIEDKLYRRGFSIPLHKCVDASQAFEILQELHEGINGQHLGGRSLARKALRAGYYWPTMQQDAKEHVRKCDKCQRHADMHLAPPNELKSLSSPWPFSTWGMDLLGPFPTSTKTI
ncbi:uncharacterized protein LOC131637579 [Vicia villosa]|uniref:uncharacterized protein LOC131637579 n=1 Tax=Vicia villosa TaxID=3911 RepID=UPI00273BBF37|nr:uncharacterized protein LOC131637579 [Vicia villosa]